MEHTFTDSLFRFIESGPTPFHAVDSMKRTLDRKGYRQLLEGESWELSEGGKYYVIRNGSSLIAFRIPTASLRGFQIMASHSDAPCLKIKENPELRSENAYVKLNVEKYGGMLCASWFDRPLSVAGRVMVRTEDGIAAKLVNVKRDLLMIPSLAIHMNREANEGYRYNAQKDLLPLYGLSSENGQKPEDLMEMIAREAGIKEEILGSDLYVYNRMAGTVWGANREFMSIGKLDDLECAFASMKGFLKAEERERIPVHCVYDNEEVGSATKQGAASTFLADTLIRINEALGGNDGSYRRALASSLMLSADNAHAVHPNYPEKSCPGNRPLINGGIVIKFSGNQKYTSDAVSAGMFRKICEAAAVPTQVFTNRSDMAGGSTLGNISGTQVAVNCVDIGLPQLAMHSSYETAGVEDLGYLIRAAKAFYESSIEETGYGEYRISAVG
ncbi:MAG: M18 family aminopeptidase [Eubacteriales bacterium]|nr:M18 family aminopeptidase [Eubacteriales bacterium]